MQQDLNMDRLPRHIECFDNSTTQGSNTVASCVVFKNTRPAKSQYRHYNIKSVKGQDDYASMREVVYRRYKRLLDGDRKSTRLNSSHVAISYAVFCLKNKNQET